MTMTSRTRPMRALFRTTLFLAALISPATGQTARSASRPSAKHPRRSSPPTLVLQVGHDGPVNSVVFSPDGKTVVTGSDDRMVKLWDAKTGLVRATMSGHTGNVSSVAFSPDGRIVASAGGSRSHFGVLALARGGVHSSDTLRERRRVSSPTSTPSLSRRTGRHSPPATSD